MTQTGEQGVHVQPSLGKPVFVTGGIVLVRYLLQYAVRHQFLQPVRQYVTRDAKPLLEHVKAADPQEAVPQDQQRPPIADHGNRAGHRTSLLT